jgi:REP element-mobilizing transposase RayT
MSHSYTKLWIHAVWSTKERRPLIAWDIEKQVLDYIREELRESGCLVRIINGMPDHVHCLFLMNREKSIAEVIKQVKGSTSHYINQNDLTVEKFAWQTGYAAFSVSDSHVDRVYRYIRNQKQHHNKKQFEQEYNEFLQLYGLNEAR